MACGLLARYGGVASHRPPSGAGAAKRRLIFQLKLRCREMVIKFRLIGLIFVVHHGDCSHGSLKKIDFSAENATS
jgi:hypothetical protein